MASKRVAAAVTEPVRSLGVDGRRVWDEVHALGEVRGSVEPLLMLCERVDERVALLGLLAEPDESGVLLARAGVRAALRALDALIDESFERLGLRSILPSRSSVSADDWTVGLSAVRG